MISQASASNVSPAAFHPPRTATGVEYRSESASPMAPPTASAIAVRATARRGAMRAILRARLTRAGYRAWTTGTI